MATRTGRQTQASKEQAPKQASIWQLKITLIGIRPPIWRRVQVPSTVTLDKLHLVIQAAMGWDNYHLYSFSIGGEEYGEPDPELNLRSAGRARLDRMVGGEKARFRYTYDFGDDWEHDILVEKVLPPVSGVRYPICITGRRACPPEDCGGIWGYEELLEILQDPQHEEYEERLEWLGGEFDPEAFDLEEANARLEPLRRG
ncbi:MAG: plasmid pRiA4b ORF-3 family protein [Chloroflexi bacterium]|nr:plasmid pRiA4b ORF-3 family protein [Chloroflexota bacterium]